MEIPIPAVQYPPTDNGTRLLIPPASRFAIAVTIPAEGELVLEMPERGGGAKTITAPGVLYTNNGTDNPPAVLGSLSVLPSAVSYADGFFVFPTQVLARATPSEGGGVTTPFVEGQSLGAYTSFVDLANTTPDVKRQILISGGFLNNMASTEDPKAFVYAFDGGAFPNVPLIQPRLNSVEEWRFVNHNNDEHPIHVHVNDFQVIEYFDPTTGLRTGPDKFSIDNANAPAPTMHSDESVIQPGILAIRTRFDEYTGLYVMHCHRLNHEDNGLMALINVIPAVSIYAVAIPGAPGKPAEVRLYDGNGDRFVATVIPFPGFEGSVNVAMGDVDGDGILDLIVGAGKDHAPEVVAYAGAAIRGKGAFGTELARFQAFDSDARGGVSVAVAQIDGTTSDNIIVGSGPGVPSEVKVYQSQLSSSPGTVPSLFSSFKPYGDDRSGVSIATGFVDFSTGRESIVTAPGPGSPAEVKVFAFPLLQRIGKAGQGSTQAAATEQPVNTASFIPFGKDYRGGVSLATGWLAGSLGGAKRIIVSQLADSGSVKIFSSGSALDGGPSIYLQSPLRHGHGGQFREIATSSHSMDPPAHGLPRPARRRAPTCWSAVLPRGARTQASSNTSLSDRTLSRRHCKPCVSARSGPEKGRSLPSSAATKFSTALQGLLIEVLRTNMLAASLSLHDPEPDVRRLLFNHLVGTQQERLRNRKTQRLGRLKIDGKLKLFRRLHRQFAGAGALQNLVHIDASAPVHVGQIRAVR